MTSTSARDASWPDVHVGGWSETKTTLHRIVQLLGKARVALSPPQPNWMHTALALCARGVTTGPMPCGGANAQITLDVFTSELIVERSNGISKRIALVPMRTLADIYDDLQAAFAALAIECAISPVPQEVADLTPLHEDRRPAVYDPAAVVRWFTAMTSASIAFEAWRGHFFGRSAIALWWGAFDIAVLLFNGKHVPAPTDRGYLMRYDLDAELMNVGLYLGDERTAPFFYGYIFPQPDGAARLPIAPAAAAWSNDLGEWMLPYDAVRHAADPTAEIAAFLDAIYALCTTVGGWDRAALSYVAPKGVR